MNPNSVKCLAAELFKNLSTQTMHVHALLVKCCKLNPWLKSRTISFFSLSVCLRKTATERSEWKVRRGLFDPMFLDVINNFLEALLCHLIPQQCKRVIFLESSQKKKRGTSDALTESAVNSLFLALTNIDELPLIFCCGCSQRKPAGWFGMFWPFYLFYCLYVYHKQK